MRTRPVRQKLLRERLDALVATFDISTIEPDPLQLVLLHTTPYDQEIAALIAAAFAYGRADIVVRNAGWVLDRMQPAPHAYLRTFDRKEALTRFAGFAHRFHKTPDLVSLLERLAGVIRTYGSLGALFRDCYDGKDEDIGPSLARFVHGILSAAKDLGDRDPSPSARLRMRYLLPSPSDGSACKRMNLFLRWMVRRTPPDLGIWDFVDPAKLIVPLDTHVHRITTFLGLNRRKSPDWKCAREVTARLAKFDPADPVRYDFAICRLGILDLCSRKRRKENCDVCRLRDVCRFPVL
ncbi:MAG TPA: TIGR02757 family protein [Thermoanaerobaculia bacterium]|nr:TIGR02757 family protein [Thermoanaerobaculia bacterium]